MINKTIVVAGGTGNLGGKIISALIAKRASVIGLVRSNSDIDKINKLEKIGAKIIKVDFTKRESIATACHGADCVISALAGLSEVIIDAQKVLLDGAILAGVPRFIPSDYSLDFTKFHDGENRNLDLRRAFHLYLESAPISSTTIFNGAFMDMLTDEFPMIVFKRKLIIYWGDADHKLWFTTVNDTAVYTAHVALENSTPRYLRIAGDQISPREIKKVMSELTDKKFILLRLGGPRLLSTMIRMARKINPAKTEVYPAWQGMQYMRNMIDDRGRLRSMDNNLFQGMRWENVEGLLSKYLAKSV